METGCISPPVLGVVVDFGSGTTVVSARGELDVATVPLLREALAGAQSPARTGLTLGAPLVLDLSALTFIDASGLGTLVHVAEQVQTQGGRLVLQRPSAIVLKVLGITGLLPVFDIEM
jgi:anti-sigma B factor antagonist